MDIPLQQCMDNLNHNTHLLRHSDLFEHQVFEPAVDQLVVRLNSRVRIFRFLNH